MRDGRSRSRRRPGASNFSPSCHPASQRLVRPPRVTGSGPRSPSSSPAGSARSGRRCGWWPTSMGPVHRIHRGGTPAPPRGAGSATPPHASRRSYPPCTLLLQVSMVIVWPAMARVQGQARAEAGPGASFAEGRRARRAQIPLSGGGLPPRWPGIRARNDRKGPSFACGMRRARSGRAGDFVIARSEPDEACRSVRGWDQPRTSGSPDH